LTFEPKTISLVFQPKTMSLVRYPKVLTLWDHLFLTYTAILLVLFVMYVLMSVVIQPSWLPNPIKLIYINQTPGLYSRLSLYSGSYGISEIAYEQI